MVTGIIAVAGCALTGVTPSPVPATSATVETSQPRPDLAPLAIGSKSEDGYQIIFATSDLGVGRNRVAAVVTSPEGLVRSPGATFATRHAESESGSDDYHEIKLARFHEFPLGTRGLYSTEMSFDKAGPWVLEITVLDETGQGHVAALDFAVAERTLAPSPGDRAIASDSKTANDVGSLVELTTGTVIDPALYDLSIAEAVQNGKPTVVVMASPAFCTNAVCGPQVEVVSELRQKYDGDANFIHVDFYDNPRAIQGDLNNAVLSPTVLEWNLTSGEWTFVIDEEGFIAARFESFVGLDELEEALADVL
jgi:hypothetical protein